MSQRDQYIGPDYERDGWTVPDQIFRGIHQGMIESRDEFPEEVKEWAAFMLEVRSSTTPCLQLTPTHSSSV